MTDRDITAIATWERAESAPTPGGHALGQGTANIATPCGCGCGRLVRGRYALGHKVGIKGYRNSRNGRLHVIRAEKALGKKLPKGACVHHVDGTTSDNSPLVICQDSAYHTSLHRRIRIIRAGGDPWNDSWCSTGKHVAPITAFRIHKNQSGRFKAGSISTRCIECNKAKCRAYDRAHSKVSK